MKTLFYLFSCILILAGCDILKSTATTPSVNQTPVKVTGVADSIEVSKLKKKVDSLTNAVSNLKVPAPAPANGVTQATVDASIKAALQNYVTNTALDVVKTKFFSYSTKGSVDSFKTNVGGTFTTLTNRLAAAEGKIAPIEKQLTTANSTLSSLVLQLQNVVLSIPKDTATKYILGGELLEVVPFSQIGAYKGAAAKIIDPTTLKVYAKNLNGTWYEIQTK